jgi:hypothetical protein
MCEEPVIDPDIPKDFPDKMANLIVVGSSPIDTTISYNTVIILIYS